MGGAPLAAGIFIVALSLFAFVAPWVAPYDPVQMNVGEAILPPGPAHLFGTDDFGRDILSRLLHGTRSTLGLAGGSALIAGVLGGTFGLLAGYVGGRVDTLIMRFADVLLAFPPLLLALTLVALIGPSAATIVAVLAVTHMPRYARLIHGTTLSLREREFVLAARGVGVSGLRMMRVHLLPNSAAPLIVYVTLDLGVLVTAVAGLSFLGFGLAPPAESWGRLLAEGRAFMALAPWIAVFPGLAIAVTVLALNLLGDGLRDMLDPRMGRTS